MVWDEWEKIIQSHLRFLKKKTHSILMHMAASSFCCAQMKVEIKWGLKTTSGDWRSPRKERESIISNGLPSKRKDPKKNIWQGILPAISVVSKSFQTNASKRTHLYHQTSKCYKKIGDCQLKKLWTIFSCCFWSQIQSSCLWATGFYISLVMKDMVTKGNLVHPRDIP